MIKFLQISKGLLEIFVKLRVNVKNLTSKVFNFSVAVILYFIMDIDSLLGLGGDSTRIRVVTRGHLQCNVRNF